MHIVWWYGCFCKLFLKSLFVLEKLIWNAFQVRVPAYSKILFKSITYITVACIDTNSAIFFSAAGMNVQTFCKTCLILLNMYLLHCFCWTSFFGTIVSMKVTFFCLQRSKVTTASARADLWGRNIENLKWVNSLIKHILKLEMVCVTFFLKFSRKILNVVNFQWLF